MNEIIDADELQKKQSAPYQFHGMTIQEVPITGNLVRVDIFRKINPCTEACYEYRQGDCPGQMWSCIVYNRTQE